MSFWEILLYKRHAKNGSSCVQPCACCKPAGCKPAAAQKPYNRIILMLAPSYYTLFLSRALLLQVEHPVNVATQLPALSPAGRERGQSRHCAECAGVAACTPEVPPCRGCPPGRPEVQGHLVAPSASIKQATPANFLLANTVK